MSLRLAVTGTGAVSAAGWGVPALMAALASGQRPDLSSLERPLGEGVVATPVLKVPAEGSSAPKASRLRRTSPISRFAAAAVAEALGQERALAAATGNLRVGVIFTLTNGCVNYSNRFFGEVLADPSVASPILFPETVFNAPSSHLSAMIGSSAPNDTLVTDGAGFFTGIDLAAEWLTRGEVDGCLIVSAEENDWLSAEALLHYSPGYIPSEGAGAIYLEPGPGPVRLLRLPDPIPYSLMPREQAAGEIRRQLDCGNGGGTLLVDGCTGIRKVDAAETEAWADWEGPRLSPRTIIGEAMGASSALQFVAAVESIRSGQVDRAVVTALGGNQQAGGALLGR